MSIWTSPQRLMIVALPGLTLLLMVVSGVVWADLAQADDDDDDAFVNGEVVVKLNPTSGATIEEINRDYGTTLEKLLGSASIYLLKLPPGSDTQTVASQMAADPRLVYAEPNFTTDAPEGGARMRAHGDGIPVPSSDPAPYSTQYAVGALNLSCAQGISRGGGAVVAVLDTGAQLNHPALADGLTAARYDFVDDDPNPADEPNGSDDDADGEVDEMVGHGTHVAGTVDLVAPEARIMPLRALNSDGRGNIFIIAEAISYAVQNGADVINLSLGSSQESELLEDVLEDLSGDDDADDVQGVPESGVVIVAAAGNDATDAAHYPAAEEGVLAITSVGQEEKKSEFANFGAWVDIAAPGEEIYSIFPTDDYASWSGTSMATPFVAGQAALIRSVEPSRSAEGASSVEGLIKGTARSLDASNPSYVGLLGAGHADIGASLQRLSPDTVCGEPNTATSSTTISNTAPSITALRPIPGSKITDRTPVISARVSDKQTNLAKSNIRLHLDGRRVTTFSYNRDRDKLRYAGTRLSFTWHKAKITVKDAQGLRTTKTWRFKVVR